MENENEQRRPLADSTSLIGDDNALRECWEQDGVLILRGVMDPELISWAGEKYREALAGEGPIDPAQEVPAWTGKAPKTRRPCDALGTTVWHEIVKDPALNAILRDLLDADPRRGLEFRQLRGGAWRSADFRVAGRPARAAVCAPHR